MGLAPPRPRCPSPAPQPRLATPPRRAARAAGRGGRQLGGQGSSLTLHRDTIPRAPERRETSGDMRLPVTRGLGPQGPSGAWGQSRVHTE